MAPQILTVLPVCGSLIGWVWSLVLLVRGLMIAQRASGVAAAAAVLIPLLGFCLWMGIANIQSMLQALPHAGIGS